MKISFRSLNASSAQFYSVLHQRVDAYFIKNKLSKHGNIILWLKTIIIISFQFFLYSLLISNHLTSTQFIATYGLFGITTGILDFIIVHDALHGAYSSSPFVNRCLGYLFDLNGTSSYIWKITHNQSHHTYTNIPGHDGDIDKAIFLRLNPKDKLYPFHYYQNYYAFVLYSLVTLNWIFYADYALFWQQLKLKKVPKLEIFLFLFFKILNFTLLIGLPLLLVNLPYGIILLGYFWASLCAGITISVIFQLAHVVENVKYFEPDPKGIIPHHWAQHELLTTSNFATKNLFLTHLIGGLNFQIEHHLFPNISHVHYPAIHKIVKATTKEFNLPYNENLTFSAALASHYTRLKKLGRYSAKEEFSEQ